MFQTAKSRTLIAMAGVTAGFASAVAPSAPAFADPVVQTAEKENLDVGTAALNVCGSWTDFETYPGYPYVVRIPSPTRNDGQKGCELWNYTESEGVFKLQDALNRCYGHALKVDGKYGGGTEAAVRNVQSRIGARVDGIYGDETRDKMKWPKYTQGGNFSHC